MPTYDVPGVYIDEVTAAGVIAGVTTSTTAFIGPALKGPLNLPVRITSYDDFLQQFGVLQPEGSYWPYLIMPNGKWFYMAHGVRLFFLNGGAQAYILRIGTAENTTWEVDNQKGEAVFRLQAQTEGSDGDKNKIAVSAANFTGVAGAVVANPTATVSSRNGSQVTINPPNLFQPGDTITDGTTTATINQILGNILTLSAPVAGSPLRIADIVPPPNTVPFRVAPGSTGLFPGTVAILHDPTGAVADQYVAIQSVDRAGFVTLAGTPAIANTYSLAAASPPVLISQEFQLVITPPAGATAETWNNLSLSPLHPNYVFTAVNSGIVNVLAPLAPPTAAKFPDALVKPAAALAIVVNGAPDDPSSLSADDYNTALDMLQDVEDVNLLCIPDAASHPQAITIQQSMIAHCFLKLDRFAILDSLPGAPQTGPGSVLEQRGSVQSPSGVAALYYPWLTINDPTWKPTPTNATPRTLDIPPSGAMAGVYALIDQQIGVHKAPANTGLTGVVGIEARLSDRQQGPLNLAGIDVLRIFPGSGQVTVWGARTTGDPNVTDWIYVNVRRLMIYIEQSIKVAIRPAVFEPNDLHLWKGLNREITDFLTRVWQDGALFGATADKAFYVRIDENNNPPSTRALGRLYIEVGVAPVRPAEFIIVRIGLWDGGAQLSEI